MYEFEYTYLCDGRCAMEDQQGHVFTRREPLRIIRALAIIVKDNGGTAVNRYAKKSAKVEFLPRVLNPTAATLCPRKAKKPEITQLHNADLQNYDRCYKAFNSIGFGPTDRLHSSTEGLCRRIQDGLSVPPQKTGYDFRLFLLSKL
ncbi:hypothetical protein PoB_003742700 [Plakobranchus ocellatus]|uniref:Uncharacterized protein n=1 Tax=Plakobranchus ocellatus TaxID=259542 RepID=A0AAV4AVE9_9GAST|nr:hypothetical protein PoB_003742700 [Plakobranchus ocellatus]